MESNRLVDGRGSAVDRSNAVRKKGSTHNILVISDLHLGEDLNPSATEQLTRDLELAEKQLIGFIRKYTRRRADGLPWRLVVNGDMVDFLTICVYPETAGSAAGAHDDRPDRRALAALDHSSDESEYGFHRRKDAACIKVDAVARRHSELFGVLASFLAAGNALEIIVGNHDTEFYWPEVQARFRDAVIGAWLALPASSRTGAANPRAIRDAIGFHPWFYYEPGVCWIEHGHQYDECCSYEYNLNPVDASDCAIVPNVDTAGLRYITNTIPEASPHGTEEWSFGGYLRFAASLGWRGTWSLVQGYYRFSAMLIAEWRRSRVGRSRRQRRAIHRQQLADLGQRVPLDHQTLRALDEMQRPPVITNLRRLLQVLMLDKLLVSVAAVLLIAVGAIALPFLWTIPLVGLTMVGTQVASNRLERGRTVDASLPLQIVPRRILELVDARYVIFGHTHLPVAQPVERQGKSEGWYYNTGTWVPTERPGLLRSFTHVVIRHGSEGPSASLCQWRDGASRQFTPDWSAVDAPSPATASSSNSRGERARLQAA